MRFILQCLHCKLIQSFYIIFIFHYPTFYSYPGITGQVHIDNHGDERPIYTVQVFIGDKFVDFGEYSYEDDVIIMYDDVEVIFPGGRKEIPRDSPECGWENELCATSSGRWQYNIGNMINIP